MNFSAHQTLTHQVGGEQCVPDFLESDVLPPKAVTRVSHTKGINHQDYLTYRQLKGRGWTKRLVERFLGAADALTTNPHVSSGRPMRLYNSGRVDSAEIQDSFKSSLESSKVKQARSNAIHASKSEALCQMAEAIDVTIPNVSKVDLALWSQQEYGAYVNELDRHKNEVAYLVAHTKDAEWGLDAFYWHQGIRKARLCLRRRILVAIMEQYPHLADAVLEMAKLEVGDSNE